MYLGYCPNHTYYFLKRLGGSFQNCEDMEAIANRMAKGTKLLFGENSHPILYCGHSPAIEAGVAKLLKISISELGGFLKPLDSFHLRMFESGKVELVTRINPIVDYVDLEAESYYK
jgi:hypothetical protein